MARSSDVRRFIECGSHHSIADPADPAVDVGLAGLIFPALGSKNHQIS